MQENYTKYLSIVLNVEQGYVDDPDDPGGATNHGITQRTYDTWRSKHNLQRVSVKECTVQQASQIYEDMYWDVVKCDSLPEPLDLIAFDCSINQGPGFALKCLVKIQGQGNIPEKCKEFMTLRKERYDEIVANKPSQKKFYKGWMNRLDTIWKASRLTGDWRS